MAVTNAMFLFEVVVENVKSLVESRYLVIRSEFADIFSLELKDPKQMYIVIPEPPPLPPEPAGKKGKKKPKPKPKGKKGKGPPPPPPEPVIQSGQSVLFTSTPEFLIQNMKKFPLEVSLWSKEDNLTYIGSNSIPWDQQFVTYLEKICDCQEPPPVTLNEEYNIFEEGTAKLMAKLGIQVKLTYLTDRVTTCFRTLSEDPAAKKVLYTGINSKTTSYIINMKTTDEVFEENCNKIENNFIKDIPKPKIVYADYKNAPGANLTFFNDGDYCCMGNADKPPESIYKSPETCPDIDHIVDYVRKIIVSCNDNMRMLTPRPTITPRIKATDIDRLCYCKETKWPGGQFAQDFKKEALSTPCPMCIDAGKRPEGTRPATFDIANIRGPCGRPDCRIARDLRAYIENLVDEDLQEINISELIGPCGSKSCTLVDKIRQFLRHEGEFKHDNTLEGLATQCACMKTMQDALTKRTSCTSVCSKDCENASSSSDRCLGKVCPYTRPTDYKRDKKDLKVHHKDDAVEESKEDDIEHKGPHKNNQKDDHANDQKEQNKKHHKKHKEQVFNVYYFTVEHDFDKDTNSRDQSPSSHTSDKKTKDPNPSSKESHSTTVGRTSSSMTSANTELSTPASNKTSKLKFCGTECPTVKSSEKTSCSKVACPSPFLDQLNKGHGENDTKDDKCGPGPTCTPKQQFPPSPADSDVIIRLKDIHNPCCVKSCDIAEKVKDFISDAYTTHKDREKDPDHCYCDCVCTFKMSRKTTYCAVCGGYECLGDDMRDQPEFIKPHPCPVYHKLYDKKYIKVQSPWPDEDPGKAADGGTKGPSKAGGAGSGERKMTGSRSIRSFVSTRTEKGGEEKTKKTKKEKKTVGKFTATAAEEPLALVEKKPETKYPYPPVPKNMGWNWNAEDIPGLKITLKNEN